LKCKAEGAGRQETLNQLHGNARPKAERKSAGRSARDIAAVPTRIWTVGHGSLPKEQLLKMLKESEIETVIDVRRWPTSKLDHFTRENMEKWLEEASIRYEWMGDSLGGYRRGGYEKYMRTQDFQRGLKKLIELASTQRVCLLCLEPNPRSCHRRFVSRALQRKGIEVAHILR